MFRRVARKLRRSRGYVMILVAVALPVIFLGVQYLLKSENISHNESIQTNAAAAVGVAVLRAYNPGLAWSKQENLIYAAGAQTLNDKAYRLFKKMPIEPKNTSIGVIPSSVPASNLAHVYATLCHNSDAYKQATIPNVEMYPITDVNYENGSDSASYNQYGEGGESSVFRLDYTKSGKLSVKLDTERNAIVCDCDCINREAIAYPAECNVDIILTIPTNEEACEGKSPQIKTIAKGYENFLHTHFMQTRGVAVGLIPYSGKISIPPARADDWTQAIEKYVYKDANVEPRLKQAEVYASDGQMGGRITNAEYDANTEDESNTKYDWANYTVVVDENKSKVFSNYGIMSRYGDGTGAGASVDVDLLALDAPSSPKLRFRRMNMNPCYLGYCNLLGDACEKTCPTYQPNPFFIQELTDDVFGVAYDLSLFQAIEDDYNKSNFQFLPVYWACNLLSDWTAHPGTDPNEETPPDGKLSHPTRSSKKKAVILVVNAPNNFEPRELTYLGFNNDAAELPMSESDIIIFNEGMRSGSKGILTYDGNGSYDPETKEFVCNETANLIFPRKGRLKIVVDKASLTFNGENSGRHIITGKKKFMFSGPTSLGELDYHLGTQGINFGGNLSAEKVKYKLDNAKITECKLYGQVLRDYVGQYGKGISNIRPLILNDGTKAKRSGTGAYNVYQTFSIKQSGRIVDVTGLSDGAQKLLGPMLNELLELRDAAQKFMDPCMTVSNGPYYSNSATEGGYDDSRLAYSVNGLCKKPTFYCVTGKLMSHLFLSYGVRSNQESSIYVASELKGDIAWRKFTLLGDSDKKLQKGQVEIYTVLSIDKDDKRKLGTYILNGSSLEEESIPLGDNTIIQQNECVFLHNNWICFNGDGKLVVTVMPTGEEGAITFYDDNRVDSMEIKESTIEFGNLEGEVSLCAKKGEKYTVSERQTFFIDPSQINKADSSGNYYIQLKMSNISLVSAEITNREYEIYQSKVSLSDDTSTSIRTITSTYVPEPCKITVKPTNFKKAKISFSNYQTLPEVNGNGVKEYEGKEGDKVTFKLKSTHSDSQFTGSTYPAEIVYQPRIKCHCKCDGVTCTYSVSNRVIRGWLKAYKGVTTRWTYDEGVSFQMGGTRVGGDLYTNTDANNDILQALSVHWWYGWTYQGVGGKDNPKYCLFDLGGRYKGTFNWRYTVVNGTGWAVAKYNKSDNPNKDSFEELGSIKAYYNWRRAKNIYPGIVTSSKKSIETNKIKFTTGSSAKVPTVRYYWWYFKLDDNLSGDCTNGDISFVGAGDITITANFKSGVPDNSYITLPKSGKKDITTDSVDIYIQPNEYTKHIDPDDGHPYYTINIGLNNAKITKIEQSHTTTGVWYKKISEPTNCAYVDYSRKSGNSPFISDSNSISIDSTPGVVWDNEKQYWVAIKSDTSENNGITNTFSEKLDGFWMIDDDALHKLCFKKWRDDVGEEFYTGGLFRWFGDSSILPAEYFSFDIYKTDSNPPTFIFGGYALPINNVLLDNGFQALDDGQGQIIDSKTALDAVAGEACDKLKTMADSVYLIKYGTNDSALDACAKASDKVNGIYNVNSAKDLENALNAIAADIKAMAEYKESSVVVKTTEGKSLRTD